MSNDWTNNQKLGRVWWKPAEGPNEFTFADEGEEVRNKWAQVGVRFINSEGETWDCFSIAILGVVKGMKKEHGTIVGHTISFIRTGLGKGTVYSHAAEGRFETREDMNRIIEETSGVPNAP